MRLTLSLIGLIAALAFGVLTFANGMQTARAGDDGDNTGDDVVVLCRNDDGDDDLEPNEEPVDDPDSEDGELDVTSQVGIIGGGEVGDPEDEDPFYEGDDCPTPTPFGFCDGMTGPGAYLFVDPNFGGECLKVTQDFGWINGITCESLPIMCWNDIVSSIKLVNAGTVRICYDSYAGGFCRDITTDQPTLTALGLDDAISSLYFLGGPVSVPAPDDVEASFAAADADCDGGVGVGDALADLQYLSGFEAGCVGAPNGGSVQGDADCSGAIGGGDVTAILAAVASGSDPDC